MFVILYLTVQYIFNFVQNATTYSNLVLMASSKDHGSVYTCKVKDSNYLNIRTVCTPAR